jgi:membrane-bound lytic murein transglycosylase MltF
MSEAELKRLFKKYLQGLKQFDKKDRPQYTHSVAALLESYVLHFEGKRIEEANNILNKLNL